MRVFVGALVIILVASSCGGEATIDGAERSPDAAVQPVQSADQIALSGPDFDATVELARQLVDHIGNADAATDALFIAAELGYSRQQILDAVESSALLASGSIDGVSPASTALSRVDLSGKSGQAGTSGKPLKRPVARSAKSALMQDSDEDKILLDVLRSGAGAGLNSFERNELRGLEGVVFILTLLKSGFTPEQVIDLFILGAYFFEEEGICYSRDLPFTLDNPAVTRPCDGVPVDVEPDAQAQPDDVAPAPEQAAPGAAMYEGVLEGFAESAITVAISAEGVVSGELTAVEELENYIASVDVVCGLFADTPEERDEQCADSIVSCEATVLWSSDLSTLTFTGTPPDEGTVSGVITLLWDTTPAGCDEPSSTTQTVDIVATVTPNGAQITTPFVIDMVRVAPPS